jgi:hypothetical protein
MATRRSVATLRFRGLLAVDTRTVPRPRLRQDRAPLVGPAGQGLGGLRAALVIGAPAIGVRWQRRRFGEDGTKLSGRPTGGRPPVHAEIQARGPRMAAAHPLGGAPRIQSEGSKLGITVAERTGSPRHPTPPDAADHAGPELADVLHQPRPGPRRPGVFHGPPASVRGLVGFVVLAPRAGVWSTSRRRLLAAYCASDHRALPPLSRDTDTPPVSPVDGPGTGSWRFGKSVASSVRAAEAPGRPTDRHAPTHAVRSSHRHPPETEIRLPVVEPIPSVPRGLRSRAKNGSP